MNRDYQGFELGPIRPPSEARSLMLRITRNCPWNQCTFCGLYKGESFSVRPTAHILKDIDTIRRDVDTLERMGADASGLAALFANRSPSDGDALHSAYNWRRNGLTSIFLQDANTLVVKPDELVRILNHVRATFPRVERITSYARSHTIARISDADLARIAAAGLSRIHIGMESASDQVLAFVKKGVDKQTHILAGQKVKRAGIELSEYVMPGLGGEALSRENALETADALNQINPDFIRIRTLGVPERVELHKELLSGAFRLPGDVQLAEELLLLIDHLDGITSTIKSDHILNLFQEAEGRLPEDKEQIMAPFRQFLALPPAEQLLYRVGRRTGILSSLHDLADPSLRAHAEQARRSHGVTPATIDAFTTEMMKRFI
jgi:hypothetical protein